MSEKVTQKVIKSVVCKIQDDEQNPNDLWAYASVEMPDSSADIVRISGIGWSPYHNPPTSYLKIMPQHHHDELPIGRVEEFKVASVEVDGKPCPALAFRMSFAPTQEAQAYRELYKKGYLDSFSIGFMPEEYAPIPEGGYDYTKTNLFEISAVSIPANAMATMVKGVQSQNDSLLKLQSSIEESLKQLNQRLELLDSALVVLNQTAASNQNDPASEASETGHQKALAKLQQTLKFFEQ